MPQTSLNKSDGMTSELENIRNQYFALVPPRLIRLPPATTLASLEGQAYLLCHLLEESRYPQPEDGYRRLFWRGVLRDLERGLSTLLEEKRRMSSNAEDDEEEDDLEIDERFYELMASLMINPDSYTDSHPDPQQSHRTFIYNVPSSSSFTDTQRTEFPSQSGTEQRHITLLEEQTVLQGGTTGLRTWTAALHLGHHLIHSPSLILPNATISGEKSSARTLELGAGTGFLSCLLGQQGHKVIATDLGDVVGGGISPLERLEHNVKLNGIEDLVQVSALDWMDAGREALERPEIWAELLTDPPDTIIAADVIYDPDLMPPLVRTLSTLLHRISPSQSTPQAIMAATVRNPETLALFVEICESASLEVENIESPPVDLSKPTFWDSGLDVSVPVRIMRITPRM